MRARRCVQYVLVFTVALAAACARAPATPDAADAASAQQQRERIAELEQQVATLSRSDQISRQANIRLQETLAQREDALATLRADLEFYERFLGDAGPPRGLEVHDFQLTAQDAQVWHFRATLSQTANRNGPNRGRMTVTVEGSQDGKLRTLDWAQLRQDPKAAGQAYAFRYLQRLDGDLILPAGFKPVRARVRLQPAGGKPVEQSFPWGEAVRG